MEYLGSEANVLIYNKFTTAGVATFCIMGFVLIFFVILPCYGILWQKHWTIQLRKTKMRPWTLGDFSYSQSQILTSFGIYGMRILENIFLCWGSLPFYAFFAWLDLFISSQSFIRASENARLGSSVESENAWQDLKSVFLKPEGSCLCFLQLNGEKWNPKCDRNTLAHPFHLTNDHD